jgi:hypothetical protein
MGGNESLEEKGFFLKPSRFAVLHHTMPTPSPRATHWDLLLEHPLPNNHSLLSFELLVPPKEWFNPTAATRLPDHRPTYLTYEGPISNNRGHVKRILEGSLDWVKANECSLILRLKWEKWEEYTGKEHTGDKGGLSTRPFSGMLELHRNQDLPEFATGSWQLILSEH